MTLPEFLRTEIARVYPGKDEGTLDLKAASVGLGVRYGTLFAYVSDESYGRRPSPKALARMMDSLKLSETKRTKARRLLEEAAVTAAGQAA